MKLYKYLTVIGALALSAGFTSCDDDDTVYDYPGVDGQIVISPTVTGDFKVVKTPASYIAPSLESWKANVRSRLAATEQIDAKFEIYPAAVAEYNAANGTEYEALPDGLLTLQIPEVTVDEETTLPASEGTSVTLSIYPGDNASKQVVSAAMTSDQTALAKLDLSKQYMAAVKMTEVTKGDAKIGVSVSNISYITVQLSELLINEASGATASGSLLSESDRSGWTGTIGNGAFDYYSWSNAFVDDDNYIYGQYPAGSTVEIDMQSVRTFDGIYNYPFYGMLNYTIFTANSEILISNDASNWTSLGTLSASTNTVVLYAPVSARYIKIVRGSGNWAAVERFNIYAL